MRRIALAAAAILTALATLPAGAAPPQPRPNDGPPLRVPARLLDAALQCPVRFTHSGRPVVLLVHGTGLTAEQSWSWNYSTALPALGFDTCSVTLPGRALGDIQVSSEYVVHAIVRVATATGRKVDVITHSQGGMEARWAMRWWPSARDDVDDLVLLASPNHGIYAANGCAASGNCWPAVWQMTQTAKFMTALNAGSETPGQVSYTNVYSLTDELVQPSSTVPMRGGATTSNIDVQSICPGRVVHHAGLLEDAVAGAVVLDALLHAGPASRVRVGPAICTGLFMPYVAAQDAAGGTVILYGDAAQAFADHPGVAGEPAPASYTRRR